MLAAFGKVDTTWCCDSVFLGKFWGLVQGYGDLWSCPLVLFPEPGAAWHRGGGLEGCRGAWFSADRTLFPPGHWEVRSLETCDLGWKSCSGNRRHHQQEDLSMTRLWGMVPPPASPHPPPPTQLSQLHGTCRRMLPGQLSPGAWAGDGQKRDRCLRVVYARGLFSLRRRVRGREGQTERMVDEKNQALQETRGGVGRPSIKRCRNSYSGSMGI